MKIVYMHDCEPAEYLQDTNEFLLKRTLKNNNKTLFPLANSRKNILSQQSFHFNVHTKLYNF